MSRSAKIREQLISSFRAELAEHLQTMTDGLLGLEQARLVGEERQATLEVVFRAAHSLKGAARAVGLTVIEQLAHSLESVLDAMQRQAVALTPELFTICYRVLDAIQTAQTVYESGETAPPLEALAALADLEAFRSRPLDSTIGDEGGPVGPVQPGASPALAAAGVLASPEETIRIGVGKLDELMAQLGELLVARIRAEQRLAQIRQLGDLLATWERDSQAAPGGDRVHQVSALVTGLTRQQAGDLTQMSHTVDALQEEIKRIRMLPLSTITAPFGRMVRDLAHEAGKEAILDITGANTELDKRVLEQIKDPLIHLLRNAIDHGIEPPAEREAAGKPRAGHIRLRAEQVGQEVVISVSDDGAGLDLEAIRRALLRHGRESAESLAAAELEDLIFVGGITTSPIITDISGRGIGLSVVRRNVEALRGRVSLSWGVRTGATFSLTLPLTLISARGLVVKAAGQPFVIPLNSVDRIVGVGPHDIIPLEGHDAIDYPGRPVGLVRLQDVLGLPASPGKAAAGASAPAVVLASAERRMAFVVDELLGEQEVVIKGLGRQLQRVAGIGGATIMGTGDLVLILNARDLIRLAVRGRQPAVFEPALEDEAAAGPAPRRRILVVDDSITTRTLERNILEAVGYDVQIATDGQEALSAMAAGGIPDLVISDILMPHMDGFELTRRLKGDERTAGVPVILVSSLSSVRDKTRGIEAGADAYIVKSGFDQQNLLDTIRQLI